MKAFRSLSGLAAPPDRAHVDTDQIIPKQFLKSIRRTGFGPNLFDGWRYRRRVAGKDGERASNQSDFVLNKARYQDAKVLLARENFGCGSSREHAVWALEEFGLRCVIALSSRIFSITTALKMACCLSSSPRRQWMRSSPRPIPALTLTVDLEAQEVRTEAATYGFEIDFTVVTAFSRALTISVFPRSTGSRLANTNAGAAVRRHGSLTPFASLNA